MKYSNANEIEMMLRLPITGNTYQELAKRTINTDLQPEDICYHALHGMVGELGEIHSIYQKVFQGHPDPNPEHLKKEVGDLLWFIAEFCTVNGWQLDDIMKMNIKKLLKRFPDGFESSKSVNRAEDDI